MHLPPKWVRGQNFWKEKLGEGQSFFMGLLLKEVQEIFGENGKLHNHSIKQLLSSLICWKMVIIY